jgi:hypothetical protein
MRLNVSCDSSILYSEFEGYKLVRSKEGSACSKWSYSPFQAKGLTAGFPDCLLSGPPICSKAITPENYSIEFLNIIASQNGFYWDPHSSFESILFVDKNGFLVRLTFEERVKEFKLLQLPNLKSSSTIPTILAISSDFIVVGDGCSTLYFLELQNGELGISYEQHLEHCFTFKLLAADKKKDIIVLLFWSSKHEGIIKKGSVFYPVQISLLTLKKKKSEEQKVAYKVESNITVYGFSFPSFGQISGDFDKFAVLTRGNFFYEEGEEPENANEDDSLQVLVFGSSKQELTRFFFSGSSKFMLASPPSKYENILQSSFYILFERRKKQIVFRC